MARFITLIRSHLAAVFSDGFAVTLEEHAKQICDWADSGVSIDSDLLQEARQWLADKRDLEAAGMDVDIDTRCHVPEAAQAEVARLERMGFRAVMRRAQT